MSLYLFLFHLYRLSHIHPLNTRLSNHLELLINTLGLPLLSKPLLSWLISLTRLVSLHMSNLSLFLHRLMRHLLLWILGEKWVWEMLKFSWRKNPAIFWLNTKFVFNCKSSWFKLSFKSKEIPLIKLSVQNYFFELRYELRSQLALCLNWETILDFCLNFVTHVSNHLSNIRSSSGVQFLKFNDFELFSSLVIKSSESRNLLKHSFDNLIVGSIGEEGEINEVNDWVLVVKVNVEKKVLGIGRVENEERF